MHDSGVVIRCLGGSKSVGVSVEMSAKVVAEQRELGLCRNDK
jgi:hypothetical protein